MIGNFALPENAKAVEYGMLFTTASGKTLTLENAGTDSSIKRLKASKHTGEMITTASMWSASSPLRCPVPMI